MSKKQTTPSADLLRKAYVEEYLKRRPDAEEFARFTETELADFIRKYESPRFESIYLQLDHHFYDRVRHNMAIVGVMRTADNAADNRYSLHLKTWSGFLESKAFRNLFKTKIAIEHIPAHTEPSAPSTASFREATEGERKHIVQEREVIRRNPQLRQMCLDQYGYQCQCCGMDFASLYGEELGAGFIEVHHLKLISTFDEGRPDDYVENLVPLCSNCHSMIHRGKAGPLTLSELRAAYRGETKALKVRKDD